MRKADATGLGRKSFFSAAGARRYHGIFYSFAVRYIPRSEFGTAEKCVSHAIIERRNIFYAQNLSLIGNGAAANPDAMPAVKRNKPIPYARSISMDGVFAGAQKTFVKNLVRYAYRIAVGTSHGRREHVLTADVKTQKTRTGKSYLTKPVPLRAKVRPTTADSGYGKYFSVSKSFILFHSY